MATKAHKDNLTRTIEKFKSIDKDRLLRPSLGEESLESAFGQKLAMLNEMLQFAQTYMETVSDNTVSQVASELNSIHNILEAQSKRANSEYVSQKIQFLTSIENQIESLRQFWPPFVTAAVEARGFLQDEGIRKEYQRTVDSMKEESATALRLVKEESARTIGEAQKLAQQIEERARRTAAHISVEAAQEQFKLGQRHHFWQVILWAALSAAGVGGFVYLAWHFYNEPLLSDAQLSDDKLAEKIKWIVLYKSIIRIAILAAVGAIATFCLRIFRAHMHMFQHNLHRQRVTNSMAAFVESAITPEQRDLILTHLVDAVASFGNSGLLQKEDDTIHSPTMTIDTIARTFSSGPTKQG